MKLILIHGRAQEKFDPEDLKPKWIASLQAGLAKSGLQLPSNVTIEFPYYGKLLDELAQTASAQPLPKEGERGYGFTGVNSEEEVAFYTALLGEIAAHSAVTLAEKVEVENIIEVHRSGPLNWEPVQKLLSFLDRKQIFGEALLKSFTRDVFLYLTIKDIKRQINEVVIKHFDATPCVVVGHSLGSVVGYLVLKNYPAFKVQKFITLGSPLGLRAIQNHLEPPLEMPTCIKNGNWFNAYDERDLVALNPLNMEFFNIFPTIKNKNDVKNHTSNRHGIAGYLDDAEVAQKIYEALTLAV